MVTQGAPQGGMSLSHPQFDLLSSPFVQFPLIAVLYPVPNKDIIEPFGLWIRRLAFDSHIFASVQTSLLLFAPTPSIQSAVTSRSIGSEVEIYCRYRPLSSLLHGINRSTNRRVRVDLSPNVLDWCVRGNQAVRQ